MKLIKLTDVTGHPYYINPLAISRLTVAADESQTSIVFLDGKCLTVTKQMDDVVYDIMFKDE